MLAPAQELGAEHEQERARAEYEGRAPGAGGLALLERAVDVDRRGLGPQSPAATHHQHGTELTERAREGERDAVEEARAKRRKDDVPEGLHRRRPHGSRRFLLL